MWSKIAFCVLVLFTSCNMVSEKDVTTDRPNIILFLVDDLGWSDVGFMGSDFYETPNIDKLANEGMVFTNAYANCSNCAPTRASLLSGLYTPRHGVYTVGSSERGADSNRKIVPVENKKFLASDFTTVSEVLKEGGYKTCHIGKWHLENDSTTTPEAQGFDVNIGGNHQGHPKSYFSPYKNPNLKDGDVNEYLTDRLTDEAINFIDKNHKNPFFINFSLYAVHTPIQAKDSLIDKYKNKNVSDEQDNPYYAAMIESVDVNLGRLVKKIRDLKLEENTIILFFSDNGGLGRVTSNAPLRGSKGMMYEGGIREPMIAWWPETIKENSSCDEPVMGIDFFPTFLKIAGISRDDVEVDGEDLTPLLLSLQETVNREALYWHFPAYLEGYKNMKHPENLINGIWRSTPCGAIRAGDWKLIEYFEDGNCELFNLKNDLEESKNLAESHSEKKEELLNMLHKWQKQVDADMPTKKNN